MKAVIRKSSDPSKWIEDKKFVSRKLRIRGNSKAEKNTADPTYGCAGAKLHGNLGCFGSCYAKRISKRQGMGDDGFNTPVEQILDEELFRKDLKKVEKNWIRIGVMGDPSYSWNLTIRVCEMASEEGLIPVVFTRFWVMPTKKQLKQLAEAGAWLQTSVWAADNDRYLAKIKRLFETYKTMGGVTCWRLVTTIWDKNNGGSVYQERQDLMAQWENVLEQPLRILSASPFYDAVDTEKMFKCNSSGEPLQNSQQRSAGPLYDHLPRCWTKCSKCGTQCMVNILGEEDGN